ncbi:hypothetical protein BDQ17DRAFT_409585 [Cyathus striatus]|nr:hypothetical protein BDQ17DRAFT_409585 [Cyathus striatus]
MPPSHSPFSSTPDVGERYMAAVEDRARFWGAEEVIFDDGELDGRGPVVRVMDNLRADGDAFDAVLDMVGGREVREAAERLLRSSTGGGMETPRTPGGFSLLDGSGKGSTKGKKKEKAMGQFTTLFGDVPERPIPTAGDHFRAGLRSLRFASSGANEITKFNEEQDVPPTPAVTGKGKVGYAWVSVAQDVDWEGEDVRDSVAAVLRMALDGGVRPWVGPTPSLLMRTEEDEEGDKARVVAFEKAPEVFVDGGRLCDGGTVVVRVAAV